MFLPSLNHNLEHAALVLGKIMETFFKVVEEVFEIDRAKCDDNTVINELETWNSLKHMELIFSIEEQFDVAFSGDEIAGFRTLGDIIKVIQ